jgi:ADP-heptose:LPS heptosyltransferase
VRATGITLLSRGLAALFDAVRRARLPAPPGPPRRLLILKPCCAGDIVLATPALAALRRRYPDARLTWGLSPWARALLVHDPRIDALLDTGALGAGRLSLSALIAAIARVRRGGFDACLVLDRSPLLVLVPWLAGVPLRVGLDSAGRGFAHTVRVPAEGLRHEAELYLDAARALGANPDGVYAECFFGPADHAWAKEQLGAWPGDERVVVLNPAGGSNPGMALELKRWPLERFAALGARLLTERGVRLALLAGPRDGALLAELHARLLAALPAAPIGRVRLFAAEWGQAGALAARAALYVGNDTGLTHVAAAAGTPVVAIFGPSDPRRYAPFVPAERLRVLWHPVAVPEAGVAAGAPADFSWARGVTVDEAWAAAVELL